MNISEEQKRWLVVGVSLYKVLAPNLRKFVEKGIQAHYTNLDGKYNLKTLTYATASSFPDLKDLKYGNINNNVSTYGKKEKDKKKYNHNINDAVDLAKLYLPEYLACFSGFDDSLDLSAMLRLLGFSKPPLFTSTSPVVSIQTAADDVREHVRNKWGHCNLKEWTQASYDDCFVRLETLVGSLGLVSVEENQVKGELKDWQSKG